MNKQANILFMRSSSESGRVELPDSFITNTYYQHLVHRALARASYTREGFEFLGNHLARITQHSSQAKQIDAARHTTQLMLSLPLSNKLHGIARYYQAQCLRYSRDFDGARLLLEQVAGTLPPAYLARSLQCLGATYYDAGEVDQALPFYIAAANAATGCDVLTTVESQEMLAILRSSHGNHTRAVDDLEQLFPLVRAVGKHHPVVFYMYLNNLAVELGEVGRVDDAHRVLKLSLASPFAHAHPEWTETLDELEAKRTAATPSIVAVTRAPEASESPKAQPDPKPRSARVFARSWLPVTTSSPPKLRRAVRAAGHHRLLSSGILNRLRESIKSRAPPAYS